MRPQRRPFAVEVKSRRKLPLSNAAIWPSDQPYLDDLPARDVYADLEVASGRGSPSTVKLQGWGSQPEAPVKPLRGLAARVFAASEPEPVPQATTLSSPETMKSGRILPSLVPATPFEAKEAHVDQESQRKPRPKRANRQANAADLLSELAPELSDVAVQIDQEKSKPRARPAEPTQSDDAAVAQVESATSSQEEIEVISVPTLPEPEEGKNAGEQRPLERPRRKSAGRVRAGEQWKRRRLPKALW